MQTVRHRASARVWSAGAVAALAAVGLLLPTSAPATVRAAAAPTAVAPATAFPFPAVPGGQAPCPEGQSRSATVSTQSFESGIPEPRYNTGFTRVGGGTAGDFSARSRLSGTVGSSHHLFLPYQQVPEGATTRLALTTRGEHRGSRVAVNSVVTSIAPTTAWSGLSIDVTAATRDEGGWLSAYVEHRATAGTTTSLQVDQVELFRCRTNTTTRVAGSDRYGTAALLSSTLATGPDTVYVAQGQNFPDALSAAALAGSQQTSVLLVSQDAVPAATATELRRLRPARIVVLGSPEAVSSAVATTLRSYAPTVERWGGVDRYATSARIAQEFAPGPDQVYVATGAVFADALSGGALAAHRDSPLLLVGPQGVSEPVARELTRLRPEQIVVLGGPASVSEQTAQDLARYAVGSTPVRRIDGTDRYVVSSRIAAQFDAPTRTYLATGEDFPDGLAGSAAAGLRGAPLLLTRRTELPSSVAWRLGEINDTRGTVLGGPTRISSIVRDLYGRALP